MPVVFPTRGFADVSGPVLAAPPDLVAAMALENIVFTSSHAGRSQSSIGDAFGIILLFPLSCKRISSYERPECPSFTMTALLSRYISRPHSFVPHILGKRDPIPESNPAFTEKVTTPKNIDYGTIVP